VFQRGASSLAVHPASSRRARSLFACQTRTAESRPTRSSLSPSRPASRSTPNFITQDWKDNAHAAETAAQPIPAGRTGTLGGRWSEDFCLHTQPQWPLITRAASSDGNAPSARFAKSSAFCLPADPTCTPRNAPTTVPRNVVSVPTSAMTSAAFQSFAGNQ